MRIIIDSRRVKYTGLETTSREPYIRIRFYVNTPCPAAARIFAVLWSIFKWLSRVSRYIEHPREHTLGKVIVGINAVNHCTSGINKYPCRYSPVHLYATTLSGFVTP